MNTKNQTNIFIVEDNTVFNMALKADIETAFKTMPMKIHSFETGEDCMAKFKIEKPHVVILDYNLNSKSPNAADGIKILTWIKKENKDTNVIILTSEDHIDIALKSFHHGASDYVVKTDTKFKKINYSLTNLFNVLEAKNEARKYKNMAFTLIGCVAILIGAVITIQIFAPSLL